MTPTRARSADCEAPEAGALAAEARRLAQGHSISSRPSPASPLARQLRQHGARLRAAYSHFRRAAEGHLVVPRAGEWMLDNYYLVQQALRQVHEGMPRRYYRELPTLATPVGQPRVYALAQAIVQHCCGRLDAEQLAQFVRGYESVAALTSGELWALPTMLRLVAIEELCGALARVTGERAGEERPSWAAGVSDDDIVANAISSLRLLGTHDWDAFFEHVSPVEGILRQDPAGVYPNMDFRTRDRYRGVIEALAKATGRREEEVAQAAIALATGTGGQAPAGHVGFYLLDAGRARLEARIGCRPSRGQRLRRWLRAHPTPLYLGSIGFFTLALTLGLAGYARSANGTPAQVLGAACLSLLPACAVAVAAVNWLVTHLVAPQPLPRLDYQEGIPAEEHTVVAIPALLAGEGEVRSLLHQLELCYLGNCDPQLSFALLTDWDDAPKAEMPGDDEALAQAQAGIEQLNDRYGAHGRRPFYLFHRRRQCNPGEGCWMGWERKRGKLVEFTRLLSGAGDTSYMRQVGDLDTLRGARYVITLDADTLLPPGSARRLVATLAHPLNRPRFDPRSGRLAGGHALLQPRVEINPAAANRTRFARIYAGDTHMDLYSRAVSDVYQDLFGEGVYVGKGIYDVAALQRSLQGRVPENALLSHDLFEGIYGRAALVSDVTLFEDYPPHYLAYARRLHRWVRGDWQLVPWLLSRVPRAGGGSAANDLPTIARWKILDNLRRSLLKPSLVALLVAGWFWLPGAPLAWTAAGLLVPAVPLLLDLGTGLAARLRGPAGGPLSATGPNALRWLSDLVTLPFEALLALDAIANTLVRLAFTHRHLLRWTTAAHTVRLIGRRIGVRTAWRQMGEAALLAVGLAVGLALWRPAALPAALPVLCAWLASPQVAYWLSRPAARRQKELRPAQRQQLRRLARRTWLYFERFVGPEDHWLPPDHYQESPQGLAAHRTSPTNIGLLLLSTLAAYDLGYVGPLELGLRLGYTMESMEGMERHRGHLLNWYDTRSLAPLLPRYVSTVDSGNLAGCLVTLQEGCRAPAGAPVLRWQTWQGLLDTVDVLAETLAPLAEAGSLVAHLDGMRRVVLAARGQPEAWMGLLSRLSEREQPELERLLAQMAEKGGHDLNPATLGDLHVWTARVRHQLVSARQEVDLLLPWLPALAEPPALFAGPGLPQALRECWDALRRALPAQPQLGEIDAVCGAAAGPLADLQGALAEAAGPEGPVDEARRWCTHLTGRLQAARQEAGQLLATYRHLGARAAAWVQGMDFCPLFDPRRQLLRIGYNVDNAQLDPNYYDLMASEARLASLLAIAKGDVPQSHWLHLARPLTLVHGARALLSWSGTMFEYLMPSLLMPAYEGTLLQESCRLAVSRQVAYARRKGVPWGISESGYYQFDAAQNYQYRAFGVPGLGLKQGLGEDLVIAPYASLLALPLAPRAVLENALHLNQLGMLGRYGYYEAVDYTPSRLLPEQDHAIVRSYMAHHQGMIVLALANCLRDGVMVRRFCAEPRVQSADLLLHEAVSAQAPIEYPHPAGAGAVRGPKKASLVPWQAHVEAPAPQVHALSNGRYSLVITAAGASYSRWRDLDLSRWRADTTLEDWGTWLYVRDQESGALWSAGRQPTGAVPEDERVLFHAHMAEFRRHDHGIALHMAVTISPDDDVELRQVTLTNHTNRPRRLLLTSYGEVVLGSHGDDARHPAFGKLFVESEYLPAQRALLFHRRPRATSEPGAYLLHTCVSGPGCGAHLSYECDRRRFLGRGGSPRAPAALAGDTAELSGTAGVTLDPVMALGQEVELPPRGRVRLAYLTLAAGSREAALALAGRYRRWAAVRRAFGRARAQGELQLRRAGLTMPEVERYERLLSALLYPHAALRSDAKTLAANRRGQDGLWAYGISGDYPILLVRVGSHDEATLVRETLRAHAYWRQQQVRVDLVIVNEREAGYTQELHGDLRRLIDRCEGEALLNQRGGIFLLRGSQMPQADRLLLAAAARVALDGADGTLAEQLATPPTQPARLPALVPTRRQCEGDEPTPPLARPAGLAHDNGLGGFDADGREYAVYLQPGQTTPAPWANVVANPGFGFLVSESGAGYTWAGNSGENRLTPWHNDPVSDRPGEALYLRDEETAEVWSPTPAPAPAPAPYLVRHGPGYSVFEHHSHGLEQRLRLFAAADAPVKVLQLRLHNRWPRHRRLTATFYAEWVLGTTREADQQYIVPEYAGGVLLACNPYGAEFGERVAFVAASQDPHGLTGDRAEFLGRRGDLAHPAALERVGLEGNVVAGSDPCAALQIHIELAPGEAKEVHFLLGQGGSRAEALELAGRYHDAAVVQAAWQGVQAQWEQLLGAVQVETPEPAMDLMLNGWLLYQALSCRVWGRSGLYQPSGAYGFRDQLQDVMALVHAAPQLEREHLLRAARHQFAEGDVLHWWHPPSGRGVRTRCSDDMFWLPFVTAHYVRATGDEAVLREVVPYLEGEALASEVERYGHYAAGGRSGSLYEHCWQALQRGATAGPHGLPLFGSGDWNDGMNRVGAGGRGESVWLGWFLYAALTAFAPLCEAMGDPGRAAWCGERADELRQALEAKAWDGEWYRRGYYDDGAPLGSAANAECRIDSIAQSWAVLSGAAGHERAAQAMQAVRRELVREDEGLVLLFAPPFDAGYQDPGYIKGYPPGVRENGGQYTHAALWAVWALAELGEGERAGALFRALSPIRHAETADEALRYRVEPYVVAADVYGGGPYAGRGGWTWYTGSAAWMYRLGLERILGLQRQGQALRIDPCIPPDWPGYTVTYHHGDTCYHVRVENPDGSGRGVRQVTLDGEPLAGAEVPLAGDGGVHELRVRLGAMDNGSRNPGLVSGRNLV